MPPGMFAGNRYAVFANPTSLAVRIAPAMPPKSPRKAVGENLKPSGSPKHKTVRANLVSRMIAARVRLLRVVRGMTQPELDEAMGSAYGTVSRIESGARGRQLSIDMVVALAKGLRCDLSWLITGQGPSPTGEDEGLPAELGGGQAKAQTKRRRTTA